MASVPEEHRAQVPLLLAECPVSDAALLLAAASGQQAYVVVWLVAAREQVAAQEVEPAWAAWVAQEQARQAAAVLPLVVVELSRSLVAAW